MWIIFLDSTQEHNLHVNTLMKKYPTVGKDDNLNCGTLVIFCSAIWNYAFIIHVNDVTLGRGYGPGWDMNRNLLQFHF
jgi:hypothetical protein